MDVVDNGQQRETADKLAILCFSSDGNSFQGRLLSPDDSKQYGLMGKKTHPPKTPYHQCCFEDEPVFYRITFIDYAKNKEHTLKHVMKTGGDNCTLTCNNLEFKTDELFVGVKAEDMIKSYFSDELLQKDCYVCTGQMNLQGDIQKWLFDEQDNEDSDSDF